MGGYVPRALHQIWAGEGRELSPACWCSSASWRRFASLYGWEYKLWRQPDLDELQPRMIHPRLWRHEFPERTKMRGQRAIMQSCIARYEILRLFGGLYVDCDLFWLGAHASPVIGAHPITTAFLAQLERVPMLFAAADYHDDDFKRPVPLVQPPHTHGPFAGLMTAFYFNNALLAAGVNDSTITLVLRHLPMLVASATSESERLNVSVEEWRVTGPEAFNRGVARSPNPIVLLPNHWVYPYSPFGFPPPAMASVVNTGLTWGEIKKNGPWYGFAKLWGQLNQTLGSQLEGRQPTGEQQCTWSAKKAMIRNRWRLEYQWFLLERPDLHVMPKL
ncbi:MAG: hypothetical protein SGPRY_004496 [Prymnesium sp.]